MSAFKCHVCGSESATGKFVSEVFEVEGRHVLVERIPAQVCNRCGEATFSRQTTEQIRVLVRERPQPVRTETMDVFALA